MSGLAGYVDFAGAGPSRALLGAMISSIGHRGPDGRGVAVRGPCGVGHARLGVIDPSGSDQPMQPPGSGILLAYNGEVYNYLDLRAELRGLGTPFATDGDTEVVLRVLERQWAGGLNRLDGVFAVAAWDERRRKLLLARDPMGVKPLFYSTPRPGLIVFASEAKALIEHPEVDGELDVDALRSTLRFGAVYGQRTLHRGIRQLEPGYWLTFDCCGSERGRFFDLLRRINVAREDLCTRGTTALVETGRRLLLDAVGKRLIADVPVGVFLSGGLDSSVLAAIARSLRPGEPLRTFAIGFAGDVDSELPHARFAAEAIGSEHCEVEVGVDDCLDGLAATTWYRDAPLSEPADFAVARLSRIARDAVKVVLSGEGADEIFCGYPKYHFATRPRALHRVLRWLGPDRALSRRSELDRTAQWFSALDREALGQLLPGLSWDDETWRRTMNPQTEALIAAADIGADETLRMQIVDLRTWLPGNLLQRGDRMTMSASLEMRMPFLDRALVPFGLGLPSRIKVRHGVLKWIVRRFGERLLPPAIVNRRRSGLRVPLASWFRGGLGEMLQDYIASPRGLAGLYGDPRRIRALVEDHRSGRTDSSLQLWAFLAAEVWYQDVYLRRVRRSAPGLSGSSMASHRRAA